jgi:hypothetical protein
MNLNILLFYKKTSKLITAVCLEWGTSVTGKDFDKVKRLCLEKTYDAISKYKNQKDEEKFNKENYIYPEKDEDYCGPKQASREIYIMLLDSTPCMDIPSYYGGTITFWEHESTADIVNCIQFNDGPGPAYG